MCKLLLDRKAALVATFLSAISALYIFYSQEARNYILLVLLSLVSYYLFIRMMKQGGSKKLYFLYLLANTLLLYTHTTGIFVIMSHTLYLALFWRGFRGVRLPLLVTQAVSVLLFSPWTLSIMGQVHSMTTDGWWLKEPNLDSLKTTLKSYIGGPPINNDALRPLYYLLPLLTLLGIATIGQVT